MQGGPSVGISTGGWVDRPMSYWSLLKMSKYSSMIVFSFQVIVSAFPGVAPVSSFGPGHCW